MNEEQALVRLVEIVKLLILGAGLGCVVIIIKEYGGYVPWLLTWRRRKKYSKEQALVSKRHLAVFRALDEMVDNHEGCHDDVARIELPSSRIRELKNAQRAMGMPVLDPLMWGGIPIFPGVKSRVLS